MVLWPVVEAAGKGEWAALAVLGNIAGGVGGNLLADQLQLWKDETDAARQLTQAIADDEEIRAALDAVLERLEIATQAQASLDEGDRFWFLETLRREIASLGSNVTIVTVTGPGVVAVGKQATAAGKGIAIGGDVQGDVLGPGAHKETRMHHLYPKWYAVAQIQDYRESEYLIVDRDYVLYAGIRITIPRGFRSTPISLPDDQDIIELEIAVFAECMTVEPNWRQLLVVCHNEEQEPDLLAFVLTPTKPGTKQIRIEYYYQRHWLTKIEFEVEVVETLELVPA
jgi:hypothetical protein